MSPDGKMAMPGLVLSPAQHRFQHWLWKKTVPRGKARNDWEVGGQKRRPNGSLQTIWDVVELDSNCSWAYSKAGTIVIQPKD